MSQEFRIYGLLALLAGLFLTGFFTLFSEYQSSVRADILACVAQAAKDPIVCREALR